MKLTFWGHACFLLETGKHRIVIDPFLTGNPVAKVKAEEVKCDFIVVSHGHGDHLGDTVSIAKRNKALVISNFEIASYCGQQGCQSHPMHIGGSHTFPFGRLKLTIAHHGSSLAQGGSFLYLGNPAGFIFNIDGKCIYHAGDTGLFYDMKLIGEMNKIDVALLPIGDNFTMGIDDAVKAVEFLKPGLTIPMHYKTFEVINVNPEGFASKVQAIGHKTKILSVGESHEF